MAAAVAGIGLPAPSALAAPATLIHAGGEIGSEMLARATLSGGSSQSSRAPGYLGVDIHDLSDEQVAALRLKDSHGAEILHLDHDGPACLAGLREHDIITQINGLPVEGAEALRRTLREVPPGRAVTLVIWRQGQTMTVTAQMANREELERQAWDQHLTVPAPPPVTASRNAPAEVSHGFLSRNAAAAASSVGRAPALIGSIVLSSAYTGAMLEMMGPQLAQYFGAQTGLLVRSVDANSPAATAGMVAGDIVIRANATPVATPSDWSRIIHSNRGKTVAVVVLRDKHEQTLTLVPDSKRRSSLHNPTGDIEQASRGSSPLSWME